MFLLTFYIMSAAFVVCTYHLSLFGFSFYHKDIIPYYPDMCSVLSLCPFVLCLNFQDCFSPFMDIDTVPDGPKHVPPYISRNQSSLGELLLGFLKYYALYFRYLRMTLLSLVFQMHPRCFCLLIFSLPFLLWPTSPPSVLHPLLWFHVSG